MRLFGFFELLIEASSVFLMVHKNVNTFLIFFAEDFLKSFAGFPDGRSSREVDEDNCFCFPDFEELDEVIDMEVFSDARASFVVGIHESALRDDDSGVDELGSVEIRSVFGISGVCDDGKEDIAGDIGTGHFEFPESGLRESVKFVTEFGSMFDDREAK